MNITTSYMYSLLSSRLHLQLAAHYIILIPSPSPPHLFFNWFSLQRRRCQTTKELVETNPLGISWLITADHSQCWGQYLAFGRCSRFWLTDWLYTKHSNLKFQALFFKEQPQLPSKEFNFYFKKFLCLKGYYDWFQRTELGTELVLGKGISTQF